MSVKQAIIIRKDLKMRRGKEIAQGSHASQAWLLKRFKGGDEDTSYVRLNSLEREWLDSGTKKIVLQVESETDIVNLHDHAKQLGLEANLIVDHGLTEFGGVPTITALAIGPAKDEAIDSITGKLKLY